MKILFLIMVLLVSQVSAVPVVYSVCSVGCSATTINGAFALADSDDVIEIQEDIPEEALVVNKQIGEIRGTGSYLSNTVKTWGSTSQRTLNIQGSKITAPLLIRELVLENSRSNGHVVRIFSEMGTNGGVSLDGVIINKTDRGDGFQAVVILEAANGEFIHLNHVLINMDNTVGGIGIADEFSDEVDTWRVFNTVISNAWFGIEFLSPTAASVGKMYHVTIDNSGGVGITSAAVHEWVNVVTTDAVVETNLTGSASCSDFSNSAWTSGTPCGTNSVNNVDSSVEYVLPGGGTIASYAPTDSRLTKLKDVGVNLEPLITDDIRGVSRPQESVVDLGAYELIQGQSPGLGRGSNFRKPLKGLDLQLTK